MQQLAELSAAEKAGTLAALVRKSPVPGQLGWLLAEIVPSRQTQALLLTWLDDGDSALRQFAGDAVRGLLERLDDPGWMVACLNRPELADPARRLAFAQQIPHTSAFWDALAVTDPALAGLYWSTAEPMPANRPDIERAVRELLQRKRIGPAIAALSLYRASMADRGAQ